MEGTPVDLWLIHTDAWQKPSQYCKAIILQLKRKLDIPTEWLPVPKGKKLFLNLKFCICCAEFKT